MAVIDGDRWRELEPWLDRALELTDEGRAAWLAELRARSPTLANELTALLARDAAADRQGFLDAPLTARTPHPAPAGLDLVGYLQSAFGDTYTIERELGGGGMGRVFVAREHALGRTVVIKVLVPLLAASIRAERFAREVRVVAALQHPNIVPLFSAGDAAGLPYYVMPYVMGESLRARLARDVKLPLADALSVLRDVARALEFAHEHGVIHRDVKPENVLLAGDAAVVTDFGIAKAISSSTRDLAESPPGDATLSVVGSTIGTPAYMAPEQAAADPRIDHRADIYAWGVLAYELFAGTHPFAERTTPQDLLAAHLSTTPVHLSQRAPELPPTLAGLVMSCMEKDAARRPRSAREILQTLAVVATPQTLGAAPQRRLRKWTPRIALAGAALIALAAVGYVAAARLRERSSVPPAALTPSLAVLPFEAIDGDTANAYLAEGIADEIAAAVSKVGALRVASRTSVAAFRASHDVDVRELGRRLGVSTVLEGRMRRSGDRMRLIVQLTSVDDGMTLWSDVFERRVKDVFRVQDEIATFVVSALSARLPAFAGSQQAHAFSSPGTANPDAYDLYLRGNYLLERRGSGVAKAVEYFERAIALDSTFARAYAGLSYALELTPNFGGPPASTVERRAMDAARRALALDPTLPEAYVALALTHEHAWRWTEAGDAFRRALAAGPSFAPAGYQYGLHLLHVGRVADAEEPYRRARSADPLSGTASVSLAYGLSLLGRRDESLAESRSAYDLDSTLSVVHGLLALAVLHDGRPNEARALARVALPIPFNGMAAYVLGATGDRAGAAAIVRELETRSRGEWLVSTTLIYAYLGVGDTARALSALEDAGRAGEPLLVPFVDPMFDPLRRSTRFASAVRRLGLDDRLFTSPTLRPR